MSKRSKRAPRTIEVSPADFPVIFKLTSAFSEHLDDLSFDETDLLVMTHMAHATFGHGMEAMDEITGGAISAAIERGEFNGETGQLHIVATASGPARNVLLIGLGGMNEVHRPTICGMYRMIVDEASRIDASKITIPVFAGQMFPGNLRGVLAVMRCRIAERQRSGALGSLKEIEVLSTAQARTHILEGLKVEKQLCPVCRDPKLQSKPRS